MISTFNPNGGDKIIRLSDATRKLAGEYLSGKYHNGYTEPDFQIEDLNIPADTPALAIHAAVAVEIAKRAPLLFKPQEALVGAASYLPAVRHQVPGMGERSSISHTTADFSDAIRLGLKGIEKQLKENCANCNNEDSRIFYEALLQTISAMRLWGNRYRAAAQEARTSPANAPYFDNIDALLQTLEQVPENPPQTFREALQSLWFFWEFQRLCGNWSGLGRLDLILGQYLTEDLKRGTLTLDEARELLAHFWIKGTEWCFLKTSFADVGSGDAQHYQNVVLGGSLKDGTKSLENEVTFLVLDIIEELHISDFPVAVRLNCHTSEQLLRRIAEVQLLGGGIVSVYQEEVVLKGLESVGFPSADLIDFTNDGCWEVLLPGRTNFSYYPLDIYYDFQSALFAEPTPETPQELYTRYLQNLENTLSSCREQLKNSLYRKNGKNADGTDKFEFKPQPEPDAVLSLVMPSCRKNGCSYNEFGCDFTVKAFHAGGLPDIANSMLAIETLVCERKKLTLSELIAILKQNWQGFESLRLEAANSITYYGNDDARADAMMQRVYNDYAATVAKTPRCLDVLTPPGVSTFGREIDFAPQRQATAFGKFAHEFLAPNLSPTPGTEREPVTSVLKSYCKQDLSRTPNGCPLDIRLGAEICRLPNGAEIIMQLLRVFLEQGGFYLQMDIVDTETLKDAQKHPENYPNLVVRISGWSARFATLSATWQDMIIKRTALQYH